MAGRRRVTGSRGSELPAEENKTPENDAETEAGGAPVYSVEAIVDYREVRGKDQWLVHWEGYSADDRTWEPRVHLNAISEEFKQVMEQLKRDAKAKKKPASRPRRGKSIEDKPEKAAEVATKEVLTDKAPSESLARRTRGRSAAKSARDTFQAVTEVAEVLCEEHQEIVGLAPTENDRTSVRDASEEEESQNSAIHSSTVGSSPLTFNDLLPPQTGASSSTAAAAIEGEQDDILFRALGVNSRDLAPQKEKTPESQPSTGTEAEVDETASVASKADNASVDADQLVESTQTEMADAPATDPSTTATEGANKDVVVDPIGDKFAGTEAEDPQSGSDAEMRDAPQMSPQADSSNVWSDIPPNTSPHSSSEISTPLPVVPCNGDDIDVFGERLSSNLLETIPEEEDEEAEAAVDDSATIDSSAAASKDGCTAPIVASNALSESAQGKSDMSGSDSRDWITCSDTSPVVDVSPRPDASAKVCSNIEEKSSSPPPQHLTEIISDDEEEGRAVKAASSPELDVPKSSATKRRRVPAPAPQNKSRKRARLSEASTTANRSPNSTSSIGSSMTRLIGKAATHVMSQPDISYAVIEGQGMRNVAYPPSYVYSARPGYPLIAPALGTPGQIVTECPCAASKAHSSSSEDAARVLHLGAQPPKGVYGPWGLVQMTNGEQSYLPIEQIKSRFPQALINYLLPRVRFGQSL